MAPSLCLPSSISRIPSSPAHRIFPSTICSSRFAEVAGRLSSAFRKKDNRLNVAKDLFRQTCSIDVSSVDGIKRNPVWAETILKSYARNLCTLADDKTIYGDVESATGISEKTMRSYIEALKRLFIIGDIDAWSPSIRSKTAIRSQKKRCLIDPSIAVAALGLTPEYFNADFKTLGFLFECLCIRDLRIYGQKRQGRISYYRDRYGLEADCVLHLENGQCALIEFKLGGKEIDAGAKHLCKIEELIKEKNEKETQIPPSFAFVENRHHRRTIRLQKGGWRPRHSHWLP